MFISININSASFQAFINLPPNPRYVPLLLFPLNGLIIVCPLFLVLLSLRLMLAPLFVTAFFGLHGFGIGLTLQRHTRNQNIKTSYPPFSICHFTLAILLSVLHPSPKRISLYHHSSFIITHYHHPPQYLHFVSFMILSVTRFFFLLQIFYK